MMSSRDVALDERLADIELIDGKMVFEELPTDDLAKTNSMPSSSAQSRMSPSTALRPMPISWR